ncbi:actin-related protein 2/3 complex subunit 2-B-like [Symsagittifera roscoffensis]|uniref:actin-related protein 2/3 complex subunit 2-B-like n=1 Tax=Symsagittifera roscoffensis TaxID=84072 RepID=UPI00307BFC1F
MLILDTGSNILRDILTRRFSKSSKPDLIVASFCDYDGLMYNITNIGNPLDRNKVMVGIDVTGFKVIMERSDVNVKEYLAKYSYAPFLTESGDGATHDINILLDFESDAIKSLSSADQLISDMADIKYHVFAAYLMPCFKEVFEENPKPLQPQLIKIRTDEAIYVRPLADQVELTYRTKFDDDDDFEIGKVFIQEFSETRVAGPGVRAFVGKPPNEVADIFSSYDNSRAAYVVISLRQQVITGEAKQLNAIKLCLSFRNYLHYHLKCSKAYIHSRMRAQSSHFIKVLNRALPNEEKGGEKKTMSGRSFMPQA